MDGRADKIEDGGGSACMGEGYGYQRAKGSIVRVCEWMDLVWI